MKKIISIIYFFFSLIVNVKLFLIMDVQLVIESIMWNIRNYIPFYFWYVTTAMFSSQGLVIGLVILCRRDAYQQLNIRQRNLKSCIIQMLRSRRSPTAGFIKAEAK